MAQPELRQPLASCPFDHHDSSMVGDEPYAIYEELRRQGVSWSPHYGGFWLVPDYADVRAALKDHDTFSSASGVFLPDLGYRNLALEQDPPEHGPFRKLFASAVGRSAVLGHEVKLKQMIRRVVAEFADAGGGDAREAISEKVPVEAIALMFGLPPAAATRVREVTAEALMRIAVDPNAIGPVAEMLLAEASARRVAPRDDFLTTLVQADVDGRPLTESEISNFLIGGLGAGHETAMNATTNMLHQLAQDPALQARLRETPAQIPAAVEECLRHRPPIHLFFRTTTRPVSLGGAEMQAGDKVCILFAAANRDSSVFADAARFVFDREDNPHVSFGWGVHRCVGSFLAQTELRLLTQTLLETGSIEPAGPAEVGPLNFGNHMGFRRLPLKLVPPGLCRVLSD